MMLRLQGKGPSIKDVRKFSAILDPSPLGLQTSAEPYPPPSRTSAFKKNEILVDEGAICPQEH